MARRSLVWSLVGILFVTVAALAATVISGNKPLLGLDLRGGVQVVLAPQHHVSNTTLNQAIAIINRRVNGLGVANSNIQRQGNDVVISLPGIKNDQRALATLGETAQLFFRPVYCEIPPYVAPSKSSKSSKSSPTKSNGTIKPGKSGLGITSDSPHLVDASYPMASSGSSGSSGSSTTKETAAGAAACSSSSAASLPSTTADQDLASKTVILPSYTHAIRYVLGPAELNGSIVKTASAALPQGATSWVVDVAFTSAGSKKFNEAALPHYEAYKANPNSYAALQAIDLDGVVESAPAIESANFPGSAQISGSKTSGFTATEANNLALVLRYGALPVRFNRQAVSTVSATLGKDSLQAGLLAGLGGIVVVLLYMIGYYRALGLVVLTGLAISGALLYAIVTELSQTSGLSLTLEGITGIIVSIGLTTDSFVVYFERLKDEVRSGKTVRTSVDRGFSRAYRTILTANFVSLCAAAILYWLSVGDVRGFAFFLGLSTVLDCFTAYFFTRPAVILLGRRRTFTEARFLGIARGLGLHIREAK